MPDPQVIDWDATTNAERKLLYKYSQKLKKHLHVDWVTVFQQAFGPKDNVGSNYEDNLRKGRISPERAYRLFIWLHKQNPVRANDLEDDILSLRDATRPEQAASWEAMLAKGRFSNIEVYKYKDSLGLTQFSRREPISSLKLKLLEEFYFQITVPFEGTLIAFQGYKGLWYPQLVAEQTATLKVTVGKHIIPSTDENELDPLWEETDIGKHSFAFLLTQDHGISELAPMITSTPHGIPAKIRDNLAQRVMEASEKDWEVFRINLMFK